MTEPKAADPVVRRARGPRFSVVWLVPILALAVSLGIAYQTYAERGVLIEIAFDSASGIAAEKTELRYRDVTVGLVEDVRFSDDLGEVIAAVRIDRNLAPYLDENAEFWVVRPEISAQGITGLNTVLSGVYIVGQWDSTAGAARTRFDGLENAPINNPDEDGTRVRLSARDSNSIIAGAPILYKGIPVGTVEAPDLAEGGEQVIITGFVRAPYDEIITSDTRFWNISGVSVSLDTSGVSLNFSSLASLVQGGISFDTFVPGGDAVADGTEFPLYADESAARSSLLNDPTAERLRALAVFDGTVGGLAEGATVRFRGVPVGEVDNVAMVAGERDGRKVVRMRAMLAIIPSRLGLSNEDGVEEAAPVFERGLGLEQGGDIDHVLDPELAGEIERGKDGGGLLAFGDQHADRGIGVDVGQDLRHGEELAHRGAVLDGEGREVGLHRLHLGQQLAHAHERGLAGEGELPVRINAAADRVLELRGVHAEVDAAHA